MFPGNIIQIPSRRTLKRQIHNIFRHKSLLICSLYYFYDIFAVAHTRVWDRIARASRGLILRGESSQSAGGGEPEDTLVSVRTRVRIAGHVLTGKHVSGDKRVLTRIRRRNRIRKGIMRLPILTSLWRRRLRAGGGSGARYRSEGPLPVD